MDPKAYIRDRIEVSERGCWLWTGALTANGYARAKLSGHMDYAHRFSYEVYVGPIPEGRFVLHHCDVRHCVNPDHLYAGTHQQNMDDRNNRGRTSSGDDHWSRTNPDSLRRGRDHPRRQDPSRWIENQRRGSEVATSKLDEQKVLLARELYAKGQTQKSLGEQFGVSQTVMGAALTGKTWAHVGGPIASSGRSLLQPDDVREIRLMRSEGKTYSEIASVFGVSSGTIAHIFQGRTWTHVK